MEIITLSRTDYQNDMREAARLGALQAMKEYAKGDEWLTYDEAKAYLHIKDDVSFRRYRDKNKINTPDKVKTVGKSKLFNKKYL